MTHERTDVVVIGSGPAGSAVARQLADWGHRVVLLPGARMRRAPFAESLPPSCRKPLAALGLLELVEAAGFMPCPGNRASWHDAELRLESFATGAHGWQIERARFDALLLAAAIGGGVRVIEGAVAQSVELPEPAGGVVMVSWRRGRTAGTIAADWLLDCSGRAGIVAKRGLRRREGAAETTALLGVWHGGRVAHDSGESHTLVEAYADGWAWAVPIARDVRCVAVMIDRRRTRLERGRGVFGAYAAELRKTRFTARLLDGARLRGRVGACSATGYGAHRHAGHGFLLVGDAGSFLDPLSSAGVKKALASAYLAAIVVQTNRRRSAMHEPALRLFDEHERGAYERYRRLTAAHYGGPAARFGTTYWQARAAAPASASAASDELPIADGRVLAAFEMLRAQPATTLRPAPALDRVQRPIVAQCEIVMADHLVSPHAPAGICHYRGIELPLLVDAAARTADVPALCEAYDRRRPGAKLPDVLAAIAALVAMGMLETATATPDAAPTGDCEAGAVLESFNLGIA